MMFTEWMVLCRSTKVWSERKRGKTIGRIVAIKGPRSYDEGYLDNDVEWLESMTEGSRMATPFQLRDMFVTFLNNCFVAGPKNYGNQ
ncbi:BnaA03g59690D [Brassica napus]|uniref:(rape) hypothetical protein n=1 Tax=Brassica napus TaxID=3708 RepID=A0A078GEB8_BRANA|nr:unnamed protein product [Brassica napus]CDY24865.1 BnaA03g59690D [Brassica napus]